MFKYILKRVFIFIPTLFAISLITFIISINAPGDPVDTMLNKSNGGEGQASQKLATEKAYDELRHQLGLDLPIFYFSLTNGTVPDTLHRIAKVNHRNNLERLAFTYGSWANVANYYNATRNLETAVFNVQKTDSNSNALRKIKDYINSLYDTYEESKIRNYFSEMDRTFSGTPSLRNTSAYYNAVKNSYENVIDNQSVMTRYIPVFHFYGTHNQYHRWMFGDAPWFGEAQPGQSKGFVRGDFGISYQDKRPVSSVLWDATRWTLLISFISIIISYVVAIPLGVTSAVKKGTKTERGITSTLFILYSLPNFWIATMLIMFLGGGDYLDWFPAFGLGNLPDDAPFWDRFAETAYHLILPVFCFTYGSLAYISRQMRGGMLNVIGQDYIRTARAKGLDEKTVIWKHALRNSLLPIITLFANIFPLAISGSFVVEFIFSIPGMGKISLDALVAKNYPIIFTVMMFTAILTLVGNLVADVLYAAVDPRISFSSKKR
jgi:peptide/nickel transport system permease protein